MGEHNIGLIAGVCIGIGIGCVVGWLFAKIWFLQHTQGARKQAVKQSQATTLGYVSEKIAPLLPDFPYHYKDLVFLGKGVDYICFDGLSTGRVKKIVFLEIKTGKSQLTKNEQLIQAAVQAHRVSRETLVKQR